MNDFMDQPQVGLRRRRRGIPDEPPGAAEVANDNGGADNNNLEDAPQARSVRRLIPPPPPVRVANPQAPLPRRPPSDMVGNNRATMNGSNNSHASWRVSQMYFLVSTLFAILAIVVTPTSNILMDVGESPLSSTYSSGSAFTSTSGGATSAKSLSSSQWSSSLEQVAKAAAVGMSAKRGDQAPDLSDLMQSIQQWWNAQQLQAMSPSPDATTPSSNNDATTTTSNQMPSPFWWWKHNRQLKDGRSKANDNHKGGPASLLATQGIWAALTELFWRWIDPSILLYPTASSTTTDIIDKILTSTPRLLAMANFLLAMTYLLHSAIASWFLGDHSAVTTTSTTTTGGLTGRPIGGTAGGAAPPPHMMDWSSPTRERMGGFLVFKLLLISAVVAPDTLDLLILLTWYTTLSCLRSLDHLAHVTTTHLSALGQPPRQGVVQLLLLVLVGDILAAASCVALFHAAGWGMVLLLTCDCALLAADVLSHVLKHFTCVLEELHSQTTQSMEARQIELHNAIHNNNNDTSNNRETILASGGDHGGIDYGDDEERDEHTLEGGNATLDDAAEAAENASEESQSSLPNSREELLRESRRLDQRMEVLDLAHARRFGIMDSAMFALELLCHMLTVSHFCHIWTLHGVQFSLIDGVLALHLHSAISTACKKIAQRRNIHSIARDLHGLFPNASDQELRKASLAGDVCCICLGTMSTGGHVKKVPCGHLYHTHCLREVVERAQSVQAAKCPLCRSCLLDGSQQGERTPNRNMAPGVPPANAAQPVVATGADTNNAPPEPQQQQQQQQQPRQPQNGGGDHALFRFSTEGILPAWIPVPAFSFEVVRRPSVPAPAPVPLFGGQQQPRAPLARIEEQPAAAAEEAAPIAAQRPFNVPPADFPNPEPRQQPQQQQSFLRRFLILAGVIPMSAEEEARALAQLVDIFPQYERSHLLRELRERGSTEAVAEAILMGIFISGVPRGE